MLGWEGRGSAAMLNVVALQHQIGCSHSFNDPFLSFLDNMFSGFWRIICSNSTQC